MPLTGTKNVIRMASETFPFAARVFYFDNSRLSQSTLEKRKVAVRGCGPPDGAVLGRASPAVFNLEFIRERECVWVIQNC